MASCFSLLSWQEISLNCIQIAYSLVSGLSRQTFQSRCDILCGKQYSQHFSIGFWIVLHWIKTAKPLRETKVNADLSYSCPTALAVVPVLYDI